MRYTDIGKNISLSYPILIGTLGRSPGLAASVVMTPRIGFIGRRDCLRSHLNRQWHVISRPFYELNPTRGQG